MQGRPDAYFFKVDTSATSEITHQLISTLEIKTPSSLSISGTCLLQRVRESLEGKPHSRQDALDACKQAAGYSTQAKTPYGFITTYDVIWCYYLDADLVMHISPGFPTNVSGVESGFNVIYFWVSKALQEDQSKRRLLQPIPVRDLSRSKGKTVSRPSHTQAKGKENESQQKSKGHSALKQGSGKQQALTMHNLNQRTLTCTVSVPCCNVAGPGGVAGHASPMPVLKASSAAAAAASVDAPIRFVGVLQENLARITWRVVLAGGEPAVVKAYEEEKFRDLELACYDALEPLQGRSVPSVLRRGFTLQRPGPSDLYPGAATDDPRVHALVLSWVGPCPRADPAPEMGADALRRARRVLERMHRSGVVHGDVDLRNMVCEPVSGRVMVFDFSHAETLASLGGDQASFGKACIQDLRRLDHLLERTADKAAGKAKLVGATGKAKPAARRGGLLGLR